MIAIVAFGVWASPDIDVLISLQKYKTIGQDYLDRKEIEPSDYKQNTPDDEFIKIYAQYMKDFQDSENAYNATFQLFQIAIVPSNLEGSGNLNAANERLQALSVQTIASYEALVKAHSKAIADMRGLKADKLEIFGSVIGDFVEAVEVDEVKFRDDVTKFRLTMEKYYQAQLEFLAQNQGQYSVDAASGAIFFLTPEAQTYYDQLTKGRKEFELQLKQAFEKYQDNLRKSNAKIPVDVK